MCRSHFVPGYRFKRWHSIDHERGAQLLGCGSTADARVRFLFDHERGKQLLVCADGACGAESRADARGRSRLEGGSSGEKTALGGPVKGLFPHKDRKDSHAGNGQACRRRQKSGYATKAAEERRQIVKEATKLQSEGGIWFLSTNARNYAGSARPHGQERHYVKGKLGSDIREEAALAGQLLESKDDYKKLKLSQSEPRTHKFAFGQSVHQWWAR